MLTCRYSGSDSKEHLNENRRHDPYSTCPREMEMKTTTNLTSDYERNEGTESLPVVCSEMMEG